jgi:hypothetical protein
MTKDEALRLALEALELVSIEFVCNGAHHAKKDRHEWLDPCPIVDRYKDAITAIKAALEAKDEPWSPVSIGVDVTKEGAHVVGIYALDADTSQIFYAKHHPAPQRTWVGLTDEDKLHMEIMGGKSDVMLAEMVEAKLKEKNT